MYIKLKDGSIDKYPYSINQLKQDNKDTSFPAEMSEERLAEWDVYRVAQVEKPDVDHTKNVMEGNPQLVDGQWTQVWNITDNPQILIDKLATSLRADAYRKESDPLFFKYQRNEATMEEWLAKVAEIKTRYPKSTT